MQYFYSEQLRRYRLQFLRIFSYLKVRYGDGGPTDTSELVRVPCNYGDPSRVAETILRGNSENKMLSVPFITGVINNVEMAPDRRRDPQFVRKLIANERKYNEETQSYENVIGNRYMVEEYMPNPLNIIMQLDIWTNNESIKEQLFEQIYPLFNSVLDIQTSENPLDWTVLTYVEMTGMTWSSRSIPIGTDNPIDVMTFMFKIPADINVPAKVKKQVLIQEIISDIVSDKDYDPSLEWDESKLYSRTITTPHDAHIKVVPIGGYNYEIYLCNQDGSQIDYQKLPAVVWSRSYPQLFIGMSFLWNGITITITHTDFNDAIIDIRNSLVGTKQNCKLFNGDEIQFILEGGGDNTFEDIIPGSLAALGLQATTYPGTNLAWWRLIELYGSLNPYALYGINASQIRLVTTFDLTETTTDIFGYIDIDPIDQNKLIWHAEPSSLPGATLPPINAIINPQENGPNIGLPIAQLGQRYLLIHNPSDISEAWGPMNAVEDDIIEFDGTVWQISFEAACNGGAVQHVLNTRSNRLFKWENDRWTPVIRDKYRQGHWKLAL
jgi:hypothetical protein